MPLACYGSDGGPPVFTTEPRPSPPSNAPLRTSSLLLPRPPPPQPICSSEVLPPEMRESHLEWRVALASEDRTLSVTQHSPGSEWGSVSAGESLRTDRGWWQPSGWAAMADLTLTPTAQRPRGCLKWRRQKRGGGQSLLFNFCVFTSLISLPPPLPFPMSPLSFFP